MSAVRTGAQPYADVPLERCYAELCEGAELEARCAAVEAFNAGSRWQKRGLAVVPTVRHVSLGKQWDNQGLCLINLYTDGTLVVHTGGIEVGQGTCLSFALSLCLSISLSISGLGFGFGFGSGSLWLWLFLSGSVSLAVSTLNTTHAVP